MPKKILIIGIAGQVGEKIASKAVVEGYQVYGTFKTRQTNLKTINEQFWLDKTNQAEVDRVVFLVKPDVLIDTGAIHNVDYCEAHPSETFSVNRDGTRNLSLAAKKVGAKFVFISTDYVFDGRKAPYVESDLPNPESVYARSKLEGEEVAVEANDNSCICRPSVIYSWVTLGNRVSSSSSSGKPLNFGAWLISQLAQGKDVNIVTDQIGSPTLADDLAGAVLALAKNEDTRGVYHTAGATILSRFDFALALAKRLHLNEGLVHPTDSSKFKQVAKRPLNSSLFSNRIRSEVGYEMMVMDQALNEISKQSSAELNSRELLHHP